MNTLHDLVELCENAHFHGTGVVIPWDDVTGDYITVVTVHDGTTVAIFLDGGWDAGDDAHLVVTFDTVANAVAYVDDITTLQPEGTDWGAWALQWTDDNLPDIAGAVTP